MQKTGALTMQRVIVVIGPHVSGAGHPVGHIKKCRHIGNVPDIAVVKTHVSQMLAVGFFNLGAVSGDFSANSSIARCRSSSGAAR